MEDLLSCMVCCEPYQEKMRHPVLLPRCGHSFCRPCIAFMVKGGAIVCPSCRMDQQVETADDLPTEFSLLAITAAQQMAKMETCQYHDAKLSFWCKTCKIATCGECLFEDHPTHSHEVIKATRYIIEMKDAINDLANKFMETLDVRERRLYDQIYKSAKGINDALRTICVLRKDMEEARDLMKGVKKVDGIAPTSRLSEAAKFLALKWNLHDAKLGLANRRKKKAQQKALEEAKEKKEIEVQTEEVKEEEKKEEGKEKEGGDTEKDAEKDNEEKEDDETESESEEEEEEEVLTEEEIRKRQKILRVKERIAAAAAKAQAAREEQERKQKEKERNAVKDKKNAAPEPPPVIPNPSMLKPRKKVAPQVSREPSITPEKEIEKKEEEKKEEEKKEASPAKEDKIKEEGKEADNKEDKENDDKDNKEATNEANEDNNKDSNKENNENNKATNAEAQPKEQSKDKAADAAEKEPNNKDSNKETPKATNEAAKPAEAASKEAPEESKETKRAASSAGKRPRGRLARQALKRAQTVDLAKAKAEMEKEEKDEAAEAQSQNIQGLDLETGKSSKAEEEKKEEAKEEAKEEEKKEESQGDKKEKEEGATAVEVEEEEEEEEEMLELDPDEKDRIATELMMVPSLTVCVEGRGGLMARMQWEPQGLHVYAHQSEELPYDVLVKSSVLNALIPTKSPTVFLDIEYEQRPLGRVYITLWGHLRRANNFLLLCTGEGGPCLKSSKFFEVCNPEAPGERLKGGDYEFNNGRGGEAVVEELEFGGDYAQPMEAGMITAGGSGHRCFDSQFFICTEGDPNRNFACPFGVVSSGLNFLKEAVWLVVTKEIWIEDCGVVLDIPRF